jgi:hypothetical protein
MQEMRIVNKFLLPAAVIFFVIYLQQDSRSIPAFARKYETSCATCHYAFPKLNAFGRAFRWLGYKFPGNQDDQMIKEKPVSMGADAYKQLWPDAIWPGSIPRTSPISAVLESEIVYAPDGPAAEEFTFDRIMSDADVLFGGTLGDGISFLGVIAFDEGGVDIEMGQIGFNGLLDENLLNLKVGKFPPDVLFVSNHRALGPDYWITTRTIGDNDWSLESTQKGFEAYGIFNQGRMLYNIGLVEGRGNLSNTEKDFYAHLALKFGGLRYNGVAAVQDMTGKPWMDNSFQIGIFSYFGTASLAPDGQEDGFYMLGTDFDYYWSSLNLFGGFSWQKDKHPYVFQPSRSAEATNLFLEADYMVYPWLIPTLRYERFEVENAMEIRISPTIQALIRANLRAYWSLELLEEDAGDMEADELAWGLILGI